MTLRVLITGVSGSGKSTVIEALGDRGFDAVDLDAAPYSEEIEVDAAELTGLGPRDATGSGGSTRCETSSTPTGATQ
ncbi:MAG TPA: hypothetical protein VK960_08175 [Acidimicrobiia bacterium]|nr:hypothetical protein [Acidimicrobiia bacterium]